MEKTIELLGTTVLCNEIIGASPIFKNCKDPLWLSFSFDVYTRQNCIPIKTDSFMTGMKDGEARAKFDQLHKEHEKVLELLNAKMK